MFSAPGNSLPPEILAAIKQALKEDIGSGDVTTDSIVPSEATMRGQIIAKQNGVVAGLDVAGATFSLCAAPFDTVRAANTGVPPVRDGRLRATPTRLDRRVEFTPRIAEGARVEERQVLADIAGPARALLTAERTALNFLGRMSGIATLTRQFVEAVAGTKAVILDTRKTAPGLRLVDKLAVRRGGGQNHRTGLYDMILIKDNHIDFAGSLAEAVQRARAAATRLEVEVEARTLEDVRAALELSVERILLDNMPPEMMAEAVRMTSGRAKLEASGNVSLENIRKIAETGVDFISIGALTHSARVFDVSLDFVPVVAQSK